MTPWVVAPGARLCVRLGVGARGRGARAGRPLLGSTLDVSGMEGALVRLVSRLGNSIWAYVQFELSPVLIYVDEIFLIVMGHVHITLAGHVRTIRRREPGNRTTPRRRICCMCDSATILVKRCVV